MEKLLNGLDIPTCSKLVTRARRLHLDRKPFGKKGDPDSMATDNPLCMAIILSEQTMLLVCEYPGKGRLQGTAMRRPSISPGIIPFDAILETTPPMHLHLRINTRNPHCSTMGGIRINARFFTT